MLYEKGLMTVVRSIETNLRLVDNAIDAFDRKLKYSKYMQG